MSSSFSTYRKQALTCETMCTKLVQGFGADIGLIAAVGEDKNLLQVLCGFRAADKSQYGPFVMDLHHLPRLSIALMRGRSLRISGSSLHPDLNNLSAALGDVEVGSILASILPKSSQGRLWLALLIRADANWEAEDQEELEQALISMDQQAWAEQEDSTPRKPLSIIEAPPALYTELDELEELNNQYRKDILRLLDYIDQLGVADVNTQVERSSNASMRTKVMEDLLSENENIKESLFSVEERLAASNGESSEESMQAKEELRLALMELASLKALQNEEQQSSVIKKNGDPLKERAERISLIAQELRQPLSSITGYTELLLSESIGILGALQRNFLGRVQLSATIMSSLIEDLFHIVELDTSALLPMRQVVDLGAVIDDTINLLKSQLLAKRIVLRVDLPRQLPHFETDRDALQQILFHLLENANTVTDSEDEITLRASVDFDSELGEYVLIQVSDTGGGIPTEELPRVFARIYRDENPQIEGVGDTGVGLSIANTLCKALGGRMWVESEKGRGTTFNVLLPLALQASEISLNSQ